MSRDIVRELALAALIAAVIAVGPLTPNELAPSLAIGIAVGGAWLFYRLRLRDLGARPSEVAEPAERMTLGSVTAELRRLLPWLALATLWSLAFWPTLQWMWSQWTASVWINDHGIFMPLIIGYLCWTILKDDPIAEPAASAGGFWLVGIGVVLSLVDALAVTRYLGMLGLLVSLPGLSLLIVGRRRTRLLAVPLVLSLLMTPVPITLSTHLYLRYMTARAVEPLLRLVGVPVLREDTVMHLTSGTFVIADACSGFSTLYASVAVSMVLIFLVRSPVRRISILIAAPLLAIGANIIRVMALILIAHFAGQWTLDTPLHEATGVGTFMVVLVGLLAIGRNPVKNEQPA